MRLTSNVGVFLWNYLLDVLVRIMGVGFSKKFAKAVKRLELNAAISWYFGNCKKHRSCSTTFVINSGIFYFIIFFTKLTNTGSKSTVKLLYLLEQVFICWEAQNLRWEWLKRTSGQCSIFENVRKPKIFWNFQGVYIYETLG